MKHFPNQATLLLKIRKNFGFTQKDLARILGTHVQVISNIERGVAPLPIKRMKKLLSLVSKEQCFKAFTLDAAHYFHQEWKSSK